jgi:hypothetical protein
VEHAVWFAVQGAMFVGTLVAALWYAPIAAALLLVSAWARRNVFLWAVLPPVALMLVEEIAFDTNRVRASSSTASAASSTRWAWAWTASSRAVGVGENAVRPHRRGLRQARRHAAAGERRYSGSAWLRPPA